VSPLSALNLAGLFASSRWKTRKCTSVGPWGRVEGHVQINNGGEIHLGEKVRIRGTHLPVELGSLPGGVLEIGDQTYINSGASICAQESVKIGAKCAIGNQALIMDTDFHSTGDHMQPGIARPVVIEDDVWLAARVTVLKGVTIGRGANIASGAVVTHTMVSSKEPFLEQYLLKELV